MGVSGGGRFTPGKELQLSTGGWAGPIARLGALELFPCGELKRDSLDNWQ
jgi:hypothetical protein